jgi:hypothetical protein
MNDIALTQVRSARLAFSLGGLACLLVAFFVTPHIPNFTFAVVIGGAGLAGGAYCLAESVNYGKGLAAGMGTAQVTLLDVIKKHPGASLPEIQAAVRTNFFAGPIARDAERWIGGLTKQGFVVAQVMRSPEGERVGYTLTLAGDLALKYAQS